MGDTNNYEPSGTRFRAHGKEMMLVLTDEPRKDLHGWLLYRHADGQWVTLRKATDQDINAISAAVVAAHHSNVRGLCFNDHWAEHNPKACPKKEREEA